ncbi:MAG: 50S ribosomal protein L9 [Elusimicrobiota bacterium]|jgi:large subunit ribosomal protein L9|nr:50S ribosomal protein L9 [Elusimicrobiota bacterium]
MKVILRSDITNIGRQGDIKEVAAGFARNFLLPKKLVMEATAHNLKIWEREKGKLEKQRNDIISAAKSLVEKLEAVQYSIKVKIGENGKIFGSVTTATVAKAIAEQGFDISKKDILLPHNIKEVGEYEISLRLHPEVQAKIKLSIVNEKE